MQSSSSNTVVVYDKNLECNWTARFELVNGNITLDYAIPMPKWSSVIYSKGNLFIYGIITCPVEEVCIDWDLRLYFPDAGHIFVTGGKDGQGHSSSNVYRFSRTLGHQEIMPSMKFRRYGHSVVTSRRCIYIFGGYDTVTSSYLSSCERFDMSSRE